MIIYKIENKINGKVYIGQTVKKVDQRISEHLQNNSIIGNALRKYGLQSFVITIIDIATTKEVLDEKEIYWIKTLNCKIPNGYNLTDGGRGIVGYTLTEEVRKKMSESAKNKIVSKETREKLSKIFKNRFFSKETREKIGKAHKNKIIPEETKRKISESLKGHEVSEEIRKKQSEAMKGKNKGRKASEETKRKLSKSHIGKISGNKGKKYVYKSRPSRPDMIGENNPAKRLEVRQKIKEKLNAPEIKKRREESLKLVRIENGKKISKALKGRKNNWLKGELSPSKRPEVREKLSKSIKLYWENKKRKELCTQSHL